MKKTRNELINLFSSAKAINQEQQQIKDCDPAFLLFLLKVAVLGEKELNSYNKLIAASDDYKQFLEERDQVILKFVERDEEGNPVYLDKESNKIKLQIGKEEEVTKELEELSAKFETAIKVQQGKEEAGKNYLQEEVEVNISKIDIDIFPKWTTLEMLVVLIDFIK